VHRLAYILLVLLYACGGPPTSVPFPVSEDEFPQPQAQKVKDPVVNKTEWTPSFREKKPAKISKLTYEYPKDTSFHLEAFQPMPKALDSNIITIEDLPSTPIAFSSLKKNKVKPSIVQLGQPQRTEVGRAAVETIFTKGILELSQDQGLPGTSVKSIAQDKLGRLWMVTDNGLCMYNGESIYTWYKRHGLSRDMKNNLAIDKNGHIWVSGNGLDELIPEEGIIRHYGKKEGLTTDRIVALDIEKDGKIYISELDGIDIYDPVEQTCIHAGREDKMEVSLGINHVTVDKQNRIWVASNCGGINIIDPKVEKMYHLKMDQGLGNNDCRAIMTDRNNKIWMGNWNGGVDCYDPQTGSFLHLRIKNGLSMHYIHHLMEDSKGRILISNLDRGLDIFDPVKRQFCHMYGKQGIVKSTVYCSFEDSENRIWFGTNGAGLLCYDPMNGDINNYSTQWWSTRRPIMALLQDSQDNIWLSTVGAGSEIYDPKTSKRIRLNHGDDWTNAWQMDMVDDGKGSIYFCNVYKIVKYVQGSDKFLWWNEDNGIPYNGIESLLLDGDHLLLGSPRGLMRFNLDREDSYLLNVKNDSLAVQCLYANNGKIFVGTYNSGLHVFDQKNSTDKRYGKEQGFVNTINAITCDKKGRVWLATAGGGIKVLDTERNTVVNITTANGLAEMTVMSLLIKDEKVYAGTAMGLSIIDLYKDKFTIKNLGKQQGFQNSDFNDRAVMEDKDGRIWWGIGDKLTIYEPSDQQQAPHKPSITRIDIMEKEKYFDRDTNDMKLVSGADTIWAPTHDLYHFKYTLNTKPLNNNIQWKSAEGEYQLPTDLVLKYDQDHLTFHFTGNYIGNRDKVRYRYILEGADKTWSPIERESKVDYRNIAPGNYTFKVCSSNFGSGWSEPAAFSFIVTPPWWKTKVAYGTYVLILFGIMYGYNKIHTAQLRQRQKELEQVVSERTKEIAEQKEAIEEKQKEILDSIHYARHIQTALMTSEKNIKKMLDKLQKNK
jgi:ligand-binding sensor domain-containing protein